MPDKFYPYYNFPEWINTDWKKLYDMANSYKRAIQILLAKETEETSIYSERDIFPSLVLIHFYIELIFKSLILQRPGDLLPTHDLGNLLKEVNKSHPDFNINEHKSFIDFLNKENPKAEAFRYNFDKKKKEYFVSNEKDKEKGIRLSYIWINIEGLISKVEDYFKKLK